MTSDLIGVQTYRGEKKPGGLIRGEEEEVIFILTSSCEELFVQCYSYVVDHPQHA